MKARRRRRLAVLAPYALLAPVGLFLGVFFLWPLGQLFVTSFYIGAPDGSLHGPTLANYVKFLGDPFYLRLLGRTLRIAALVAALSLLFAYPAALELSRRGRASGLLVLLLVLPLCISLVIRGIGWMVLLGPTGGVASLGGALGLAPRALSLLYTEAGIVIGLTNVLFPFMFLSIHAALGRIDPSLERAAADLGATPGRTLLHVVAPLSLPGVLSGSVIVFTLAASFFVIPAMLGGDRVRVVAGVAYDQAIVLLNLPYAATTCVVLLAVVTTTVWAAQHALESGRWRMIFRTQP